MSMSGNPTAGSETGGGGPPKANKKSAVKKAVKKSPGQEKEVRRERNGSKMSGDRSTVTIQIERQIRNEWCWAAVSASVHKFFRGVAQTQCQIAATGAETRVLRRGFLRRMQPFAAPASYPR